LPSGKNRLIGGNGWFYQVDGSATLFPPGGTRRLYVSQAGRRYHFQTRSNFLPLPAFNAPGSFARLKPEKKS
jgi:hypothetical protein